MRDVKDLNKKSDQEAKRLKIYLAAAYGVTFLMGLLMWFGNSRHYDLSAFPNAQMVLSGGGGDAGRAVYPKGGCVGSKGVFYIFELCDSSIGSGGSVVGDSALCNGILYGNTSIIVDAGAAGAYYRRKHRGLDSPAFDKEGKTQSVWIVLEQERGIMVLYCFVCGGLSL